MVKPSGTVHWLWEEGVWGAFGGQRQNMNHVTMGKYSTKIKTSNKCKTTTTTTFF